MRRRLLICLAALALLLPGVRSSAQDALQTLEIASRNGVHHFAVELAATPEQTSRGLMFRNELPEGRGMLFDFKRDG